MSQDVIIFVLLYYQVISEVKNGYRLPKPRYCPDDVFEIMTDCW